MLNYLCNLLGEQKVASIVLPRSSRARKTFKLYFPNSVSSLGSRSRCLNCLENFLVCNVTQLPETSSRKTYVKALSASARNVCLM